MKVGAKALKRVIDVTFFGTIDNLVGALTGIFKWAFLVSILVWVFESIGFSIQRNFLQESIIFPYVVDIGPIAFTWLGTLVPIIQDLIDSLQSIPTSKRDYMTFVC